MKGRRKRKREKLGKIKKVISVGEEKEKGGVYGLKRKKE